MATNGQASICIEGKLNTLSVSMHKQINGVLAQQI